ncbi:MAG: tetratricopeptide repeat protein [Deltaproteobacteria bacterium]|nr:tetratricopeptide repeat protein [Deltaproteobacteria bacterium]
MSFRLGPRQILASLLIIGLCVLTVQYGLRTQTYEDRLKKAEKRWKEKRFEDAIKIYLNLADADPKNTKTPEILLQIGDIYNLSLNQIDKALQTYTLVSIRYPSTNFALQAFTKKAEIYFATDQHQQALKEYQNILENFPNLKEKELYQLKLGIAHLKLKQFEGARREFKLILDQNLNTPLADQVLFHTANSYFLEDKPNQAIPIYQSLIKNYPKSSMLDEAKFNMADCYESLGDFDQALSIYEEIKNTYPNPKVIELQIQRSKERKVEFEKQKQKMLTDKKKLMNPSSTGSTNLSSEEHDLNSALQAKPKKTLAPISPPSTPKPEKKNESLIKNEFDTYR